MTDMSQLTADLAAISRALREHPALCRVLIDPSAAPAQKAGLVAQVFGALGEPARQQLLEGAGQSWKSRKQFLAWVQTAVVTAAWDWAKGLGVLDRSIDEVFAFGQLVARDHQVRAAVTDSRVPVERRQELVGTLGAAMGSPALAVAMAAVAMSAQTGTIDQAVRDALEAGCDSAGGRLAIVTVARPMPPDQFKRLNAALERRLGAKIIIQEVVDATVLGGVRVECGAEVIEATTTSRLAAARKDFA